MTFVLIPFVTALVAAALTWRGGNQMRLAERALLTLAMFIAAWGTMSAVFVFGS